MLRRAAFAFAFVVLLPASVEAFDHHHHHHSSSHHSSGNGCGSSDGGETASPSSPSTPAPSAPSAPAAPRKRVFVTSAEYAGAVGGLAAADGYCRAAAAGAGLSGTWVAWLSDRSTNAIDHVEGEGPWYTTDGALAFASKDALRSAPLAELRDERGAISEHDAWSGSDASGIAAPETCDGWTNATSSATATLATGATEDGWAGGGSPVTCDRTAALICFEL